MFNSLSREDIHRIIDIELDKLYSRVTQLGYTIELTEKAKDFIVEKGYDQAYGARPLKRAIQKYLEDPLAEEIIKSGISEGDVVTVDYDDEKKDVVISVAKPKTKKKSKEE
jgi:ATP-dependent Clp protease ATP-binding subunit ClpC